jgi:hypothetical protein
MSAGVLVRTTLHPYDLIPNGHGYSGITQKSGLMDNAAVTFGLGGQTHANKRLHCRNQPELTPQEQSPVVSQRFIATRIGCSAPAVALLAAVLVILSVIGYGVSRGLVRAKSLIDNGSVGVDYLNTGYARSEFDDSGTYLLLSAEYFGQQKAGLDHWGWVESIATVIPPLRKQFRALRAINRAGFSLVAAPAVSDGNGIRALGIRGSRADLCAASADLDALGGGLYSQFVKTRTELKALIRDATGGRCGR